jgi:hypothetical protein
LPKTVLFAAGDPGGANAIRPVLLHLVQQNHPVVVLDHGIWAGTLPPQIRRVGPEYPFEALCFGTSLTDTIPLALARQSQVQGKLVVSVLDNWVNYRARLMMDGLPAFIPDIYAVMDEKAKLEAINDGVPASCLRISGHPNLAGLATDAARATPQWQQQMRQDLGLGKNRRQLIVFVNEPVSHDQGNPDSPQWRGYTEEDALKTLIDVTRHANADIAILPHPRDDVPRLHALWAGLKGEGRILQGYPARDVMLAADRVAGMASIILYESWLVGKPTLSIQPGLVRNDLLSIASRPGITLISHPDHSASQWLHQPQGQRQPDLALHQGACAYLGEILGVAQGR